MVQCEMGSDKLHHKTGSLSHSIYNERGTLLHEFAQSVGNVPFVWIGAGKITDRL